MKKLKAFTAALLAIILLITSLSLISCGKKDNFPNIDGGEKVDLSEENLKIKKDLTVAKEKEGYVADYTITIDVEGYKEFSYFEGGISFTWTYEVLLDGNEGYTEDSFTTTIDISATGEGKTKEVVTLENCRSVRNINCELSFYGYAVRK